MCMIESVSIGVMEIEYNGRVEYSVQIHSEEGLVYLIAKDKKSAQCMAHVIKETIGEHSLQGVTMKPHGWVMVNGEEHV